jgi:hypothetical protein
MRSRPEGVPRYRAQAFLGQREVDVSGIARTCVVTSIRRFSRTAVVRWAARRHIFSRVAGRFKCASSRHLRLARGLTPSAHMRLQGLVKHVMRKRKGSSVSPKEERSCVPDLRKNTGQPHTPESNQPRASEAV